MMIKPGITELSRYVDSRYTLVSMAAKRARMISEEQNSAEVYDPHAEKPVTIAVNEIAKGKVGYVRSESIKKAREWEKEKAEAMSNLAESDSNPFYFTAADEVEAVAEELEDIKLDGASEETDAAETSEDDEQTPEQGE